MMKVGDLVRDKRDNAVSLIIYKDDHGDVNAYRILNSDGTLTYVSKDEIEKNCEIFQGYLLHSERQC